MAFFNCFWGSFFFMKSGATLVGSPKIQLLLKTEVLATNVSKRFSLTVSIQSPFIFDKNQAQHYQFSELDMRLNVQGKRDFQVKQLQKA